MLSTLRIITKQGGASLAHSCLSSSSSKGRIQLLRSFSSLAEAPLDHEIPSNWTNQSFADLDIFNPPENFWKESKFGDKIIFLTKMVQERVGLSHPSFPESSKENIRTSFISASEDVLSSVQTSHLEALVVLYSESKFDWELRRLIRTGIRFYSARAFDRIPPSEVINLFLLFSKTGIDFSSKTLSVKASQRLFTNFDRLLPSAEPKDLVKFVIALGRFNYVWKQLPSSTRAILEKKIEEELFNFDLQDICTLFSGFRVLSHGLNVACIGKLMDRIKILFQEQRTYHDIVTVLNGLMDSALTKSHLNTEFISVLFQAIENQTEIQPTSKDIAGLVYVLGKFNFHWDDLPESTQQILQAQLSYCVEHAEIQDLTTLLVGFQIIGYQVRNHPEILQKVLAKEMSFFQNPIGRIEGKELDHFVKFVYSAGFQSIQELPKDFLSVVMNSIEQLSHTFSPFDSSDILFQCSRLGLHWNDFTEMSQQGFERSLLIRFNEIVDIDLARFIVAFNTLEYRWYEQPLVREAIFKAIGSIYRDLSSSLGNPKIVGDERQVSRIIFQLGQAGIRKDDLSKELQTVLLGALKHFSLRSEYVISTAEFISGLGHMGWKWSEIPEEVQKTIKEAILHRYEKFNISMFHHLFQGLKQMDYRWYQEEDMTILAKFMYRVVKILEMRSRPFFSNQPTGNANNNINHHVNIQKKLELSSAQSILDDHQEVWMDNYDSKGIGKEIIRLIKILQESGCPLDRLPFEFYRFLSRSISTHHNLLEITDIIGILSALRSYGFTSRQLEQKAFYFFEISITSVLMTSMKTMTTKDIAEFLTEADLIGLNWNAQKQFRAALFAQISSLYREIPVDKEKNFLQQGNDLLVIMESLLHHGWKKENFPISMQHFLSTWFERCLSNSLDLSVAMKSLRIIDELGLDRDLSSFNELLLNELPKIKDRHDLVSFITSLSKTKFKLDDHPAVKQQVFLAFQRLGVTNNDQTVQKKKKKVSKK